MAKQYLARYGNDQVPVVVTLDEGSDVTGALYAWEQLDDDSWRGHVVYHGPHGNRIGTFRAEAIRETGPQGAHRSG